MYIYQHLGLGDHIICNSIIRHYSKLNDIIYLFVKPHNYKNVSFMFNDLKNIKYIQCDDNDANKYISSNNITPLRIGFDKLDRSIGFDVSFYKQLGFNFETKWSNFYINRDMDKEKKVYDRLVDGDYIFVHDDMVRGYKINDKYLPNCNMIRPNMEYDFFDFCYLIENAKEIHLMESSYKCLVEHLNIKTDKLFYHTYIRNYPKTIRVTSKYQWKEY